MNGDGAGHAGDSQTTSRTTTLFRDGVPIGGPDERGGIDVPASEAAYRLATHTERGAPFVLSTKVDTAWTFRSGHVDGDTRLALPLWAIRFAPRVDQYNTLPAGGVHAVPMFVTPQPGAEVGEPASRTVEASFDDGATWTPVKLKDGNAVIRHPHGEGFVSLRATAADSDGNTLEQTVIHAYRYGTVR